MPTFDFNFPFKNALLHAFSQNVAENFAKIPKAS
jgi:hypothetical protein